MLNPARHLDGIKEIYGDMKAGTIPTEMDCEIMADAVLYAPMHVKPNGELDTDPVMRQILPAILEYGDAVKDHGLSPNFDNNEFSKIDLTKLRILEGISQTMSSIHEITNFGEKTGLSAHESSDMMTMMRTHILDNKIQPMNRVVGMHTDAMEMVSVHNDKPVQNTVRLGHFPAPELN